MAEECEVLLNRCGIFGDFLAQFDDTQEYASWFCKQNFDQMKERYEYYKLQLQVMSYKLKKDPWGFILKSRIHLFHLASVKAVFPEALFVWTHRNLDEIVPSFCSLELSASRVMGVNKLSKAELGRNSYQHLVEAANTAANIREKLNLHCVDIDYESLVADPLKYVKLIYDRIGLGYSDSDFRSHTKFLDENSQHKFGRHEYSLEDWGLEKENMECAFEAYLNMEKTILE